MRELVEELLQKHVLTRSYCESVTAHRNGFYVRIRATKSMFIASDDSISHVFKLTDDGGETHARLLSTLRCFLNHVS